MHAYLESLNGGRADSHALYVLSASANDCFQMADFGRSETPRLQARRAAANTAHAVELLIAAGARTLMVSSAYLPNAVPAVAG